MIILFGLWAVTTLIYFTWLTSKISLLEIETNSYKSQLRISQNVIRTLSKSDKLPAVTYEIPVIIDAPGSLCETIHISLVCMNKCSHFLLPMLKSLFSQRQNPIMLHILVDDRSEMQTKYLFDSWDLPDVKVSYYNAQNKLPEISWIKNSHYSGVYALYKLLLPEILPSDLDKVIALDADLTFMSDIALLWNLFTKMSKKQFLGLVENESNWYLERDIKNRWPALGRGFNTGVMLLDLKKMRSGWNWKELWNKAVVSNIDKYKETALADQDIINAVIQANPSIVLNISCAFNVQMSMTTLAKYCYREDVRNVKILHWNSPRRMDVKHPDAEYFRDVHRSYVNMDVYLLRSKLHKCSDQDLKELKSNNTDLCREFRFPRENNLVTLLYYTEYAHEPIDNFDVTLVLQLSMDRLQFLERLVKYWEGPLSATVYLSNCELSEFESFINDWSETLSTRKNVGYHLVFKRQNINYPVNYLRNVALENVNTEYVFLIDVDFIPMSGLYEYLRDAIRSINPVMQKKALVVPAFETQNYRLTLPKTKQSLVAKIKGGRKFAPFREREWPAGHLATNYSRWMDATKPYEVEWQPNYEPYLVVHRSVPRYDVRFTGFGWNKVSHSVELKAAGYRPWVLPEAFIIHAPHAPSADITKFRVSTRYRACQKLLKQEFLDDLKRKYKVEIQASQFEAQDLKMARDFIMNQAV